MATTFVAISDPKKVAQLEMAGWLWTKNTHGVVYPYTYGKTELTEPAHVAYWECVLDHLNYLGHEFGYMEQD